jgi:hypothetical protein
LFRDGEFAQASPGVLVEILKRHRALPGTSLVNSAALVVKYLFHAKACNRAVEQAEEGEMVVFGGTTGQLDNWSGTVKYLPTAVEHEVIVRGYEGKGNGQRLPEPMSKKAIPFPPCATEFSVVSTEFTTAP